MSSSRQRNLLIALGLVLLAAAWRLAGPMLGFGGDDEVVAPTAARRPATDSEGDPVSRPGSRRAGATHGGAHPGDRVEVLRLADLDRAPRTSTPGRNPWSFIDPPPPPPPKPPKPYVPTAAELAEAERLRLLQEEQARLAAIEAAKPKPPAFNLQYLGRFGPPEKKIAVFSNGKATFIKQEGEDIDGKFIVSRIGYESVDIRFVNFPEVPAKRVGVTPRRQGPVGGNPG
ncbi:MAG: hypothetical protein ABIS20_15785 [Thermoanaerobaculia bacterium]